MLGILRFMTHFRVLLIQIALVVEYYSVGGITRSRQYSGATRMVLQAADTILKCYGPELDGTNSRGDS